MARRRRPTKRTTAPPRKRSISPVPKNWFATLPNELVILSTQFMKIPTLRSLSMTSKRYHDLLGRGFVYKVEVEGERLFDEARKRFEQLRRVNGLAFDNKDILKWPGCKLRPQRIPLSEDDRAFLDSCVDRWVPGSIAGPEGNTLESKLRRAIREPQALFAPVLWACSQNRVDVLELLQNKYKMEGKGAEEKVDIINVVVTNKDTEVITGITTGWRKPYRYDQTLVDAWQAAFYNLDQEGSNIYHFGNAGEDVCIWLLNKNLGFSTRPDGITIAILAEAAVYKKRRLLSALIDHFKDRLATEEFQCALTMALHTVARASEEKTGDPRDVEGLFDMCDKDVIDTLIGSGTGIPLRRDPHRYLDRGLPGASVQLRQDPHRAQDKGLLARAVTWTPSIAVYLLELQMAQGMTDYRDLRAAILQTIMWGGKTRLEFLKMVFPLNVDLLYSPDERKSPQGRFLGYRNLIQSFIDQMRKCFKSDRFNTALYLVEILGYSRVGSELVAELKGRKSEL
ncbi:hypothetical protein PG996_007922 [Apiospora saccharicola]|uniref:F-box domain-containing protein n=1 Tax=Apiospora saccharicola TaxID=335842 RepID=A0ABR1UWF7_9PEZI